jgi:Ras-related GTP-binding protein C/D
MNRGVRMASFFVDSEVIFGGCGALVFVIDAQDDYMESLAKLHETVTKAYKVTINNQLGFFFFCQWEIP